MKPNYSGNKKRREEAKRKHREEKQQSRLNKRAVSDAAPQQAQPDPSLPPQSSNTL